MKKRIYEVWGRWVIAPAGARKEWSLAVEGDRIIDIGKKAEIRGKYKFSDSLGGEDRLVCPGFVDTHMHSYQVATKGIAPGMSLLAWLRKHIWKWEGALTKEKAKACAEVAYLQMIRSGTTSFSDFTAVHHAEEAFRAAERFGLRGMIGKTLMDRNGPPEQVEDTDFALRESEKLLRKWNGKGNGRLRYALTPRFALTCTDELLLGAGEMAERYGVFFRTHTDENTLERKGDMKMYGTGSIRHFEKLGLLNRRALLAHCIWCTEKELGLLKKRGVKVAHCPGSNMFLASGVANVPEMLRMGITVGLGTDVAAYCNFSMMEQMRLACLLQKVHRRDPHAMEHTKAFAMGTWMGAQALGMGDTGKLAKGMKADILLLSTNHLAFSPMNDPISQIIYSAFPSAVDTTICDGRILMRGRKVLVANSHLVMQKARELLEIKG